MATKVRRLVLVSWLAAAGMSAAQEASPSVGDHLSKINLSLEKIASLLARQSDSDDLDLLMKRVQLGVSQVSDAERQLNEAKTRRESLQDRKSQLEMQLEMNRWRSEHPSDQGLPPEELESLSRTWQEHLKRVNLRIAEASAEIADLEGRVAEIAEGLEGWQAVLDRRLGGR